MLDERSYPVEFASRLGHTTSLNNLLGANQKGAGRVTLQVQGSGPVRLLGADCTAELRIRGMAHYRKEGLRKTNERNLLGDGRLSVTLEDLQSGRFYQSLVPLEGETLEQIFQHYLSQSEQLPAYLRLYADDGALCGLLLEKLPGADSRDPDGWSRVTQLAATLTLDETRRAQPYAPPQPITPAPAAEPPAKAPEAPKPDPNQELAARVKKALEREAKIQAAGIDVTAADGRVSLWGTAATAAERKRAESVASKVDGVRSVDNQIKVVKGS